MLAAALLNYADDEGYFNANPALVKAECCPLREDSVNPLESLRSLQKTGYIRLGTGENGRRYGHIVNFLDHQKVSHPTSSKIGPLSITWEDSGKIPEDSVKAPERLRPERKGRERKGKEHKVAQGATSNGHDSKPVEQVFEHWKSTFEHPKAVLTPKRRKLIRAALADYSLEDVLASLSGYQHSPHHMGENDRKTRYDDIELFLRDAKHIEAGLGFAATPPGGQSPEAQRKATGDLARLLRIEREANEPWAHFEDRVKAANQRRLDKLGANGTSAASSSSRSSSDPGG